MMNLMARWIIRLYRNELLGHILHTPLYCLKKALIGCSSVLDIGCGPDSSIQYCNIGYSIGVDIFLPFIELSKKKKIHNEYIMADIPEIDFKPKSFDAVVMIEVLEHLSKEQGIMLLEKAQGWARKKVIISTPNGFLAQSSLSDNPYEVHRSGWYVRELNNRGYKAYGMGGWKFLRKENTREGYGISGNAIFSTIRFRPQVFWVALSAFTQLFTYYFPVLSYSVFYVKNI